MFGRALDGRLPAVLALCCAPLAAGPAAEMARAVRETTLDPAACYRVRDLTLFKEDIRIYLADGYLIFSHPVAGRPIAAVFTTDVENGGGEVILRPPSAAERRSLATYTGSPNLDEQFRAVLLFFTGDVYQSLLAEMPNNPVNRRVPEMGPLLAEKWNPVLRTFSAGLDLRLALDLLNSSLFKPDFLSASFEDAKLGNFDLLYDPGNTSQISAGQLASRDGHVYFDTWTHFPAKSSRDAPARPAAANNPPPIELSDYRITATVSPDLNLSAVSKVKVKTNREGLRVVPFDIAQEMTVSAVSVNGMPVEFVERDQAVRAAIARGESTFFLVMPPEPLHAGEEYEFEFHHSGKVILDAGGRVYYVTARGNWYPNLGGLFSTFDLTFRYPRDLELVTPGDVVEDRTEGEWRITRRKTAPIRLAGFNLGDYAHAKVAVGNYTVDVCGNRTVEPALRLKAMPEIVVLPNLPRPRRGVRGPVQPDSLAPPVPTPDPVERLEKLATEIGGMVQFMAANFGPPALPHLTVSPIPGNFGQGYPGLIYLSTRSYLSPSATPEPQSQEIFFDELLEVHEAAHQWWGAQVAGASYRDDWLMEALANYSAMLYLEKTRGEHEIDELLNEYRTALLAHQANGAPVDAAGPIVMGARLESSLDPRAWRAITYGKGSWILHMLRRRMGDERFLSMLAEIMKRYGHTEITTGQFRLLAAEFLPPKSDDPKLETFFDQWVYSTGIPTLKLTYTLKGKAGAWQLSGTLAQSDVPDDFEALAPIEIQLPRGQTITRWVRASSAPATFEVKLAQAPLKVLLDPHNAVLRR
ncbi:MAG TPA: M1 family aminopeptidase [Bryobacteraceae bacterium]|nr:M1 family aminopeptidase [Bryobacteraceae bacterium]